MSRFKPRVDNGSARHHHRCRVDARPPWRTEDFEYDPAKPTQHSPEHQKLIAEHLAWLATVNHVASGAEDSPLGRFAQQHIAACAERRAKATAYYRNTKQSAGRARAPTRMAKLAARLLREARDRETEAA